MEKIIIKNQNITVTVLTLGAIIQGINAFGVDLTCGYATEEEYFNDTCYFGGLIGRTANRCGSTQYINNIEYSLPLNEKGINHLHGGMQGFNLKRWTVTEQGGDFVTLNYISPDGEEGYPGNLCVYVTYRLVDDSLLISYKATTDKPTWVNLTNHSYFNPFGVNNKAGARIIGGSLIELYADRVSVYDENTRVVGSMDVEGTEFDLRKKYPIERFYDHNFYLSGNEYESFCGENLRKAAKIYGSINIECFTDMPCIQLYCGEYIPENTVLADGSVIGRGSALCLETQNEPNMQARGEGILMPDSVYNSSTAYRFSVGGISVVEK
ncbi:MAG: galactose mutarotase [Clostridia bacterium]|nr:galactose mutarotase [Clostridia bacterium]